MANVLVIRLSSFGDVALLAPVLYSVASRYPRDRFTIMTRQSFAPLFSHLGFNIAVMPLDMRKKHRGVLGLFRILGKVFGQHFTHVADTHSVLRTVIIRTVLASTFGKVRAIDKGRGDKRRMIETKKTSPMLKHTTERYLDVFNKLGFPATITFENLYDFKPRLFSQLSGVVGAKNTRWIGIAPFAQHRGKVYPLQSMAHVVEKLCQRQNTNLFIFGAGDSEMPTIKEWTAKYPNIISHHGLLKLDREILLMSYLDVMVSMDSANMHLASLVKVPVVSIWGATHPALGFYGYGQDLDNAVQDQELACRPCSVYGNTPCVYSGAEEYKCMEQIAPQQIVAQVEKFLIQKEK